ncbi:hypothetical protein A3A67_01260 [Candidatus Peribacteria bacterium RIFCSPLOWO2_01_FULL_51_18]|nr:MAG: hypothetical protein A3C52_04450 [Candidatus Peribacteria bacterium RIFCSPHIGHO2_02_FULL_51_15]OGJ65473.1 MAG: hypothetical protein A3A67_01260 [Candidatus Peribacteria bacterium RIFCSPLOWO2_01_FULL_51_18]OGJ67565.1 MAG: hypothetical protein A3J34_03600 [Candidatus Peribacteria bacterium RIFCSPLOWO2_02_FULL_51_10]
MGKKWFLAGLAAFLLAAAFIIPGALQLARDQVFGSDAVALSKSAINLLQQGFLSPDNLSPLIEREPGMSVFLAIIYLFFGVENPLGLFLTQGVLFFIASFVFSNELAKETSSRAGGICFLLLLTSGSALHSVYSAYRECLALSILLFFAGLYFSERRKPALWKATLMGFLLAALILTYYSFVLFAPLIIFIKFIEKRRILPAVLTILICYTAVAGYALRNFYYDGYFRVIGETRANAMWYVRGEQAENIRGFEPFHCLWSEYISRDWTGRSPQCSFNSVKNSYWINGYTLPAFMDEAATDGRQKILKHFGWYLWFSIFEVLELHIPFVGGGISHYFNIYIAVTGALMYLGMIFGLRSMFDRRFVFLALIILYNVGVFALTDATPRYLVPVLFGYAVFAAIGYDALLSRLKK